MQKLEQDSRIRAYLNLHVRPNELTPALEQQQRMQLELHDQPYSQLEIFAKEWREAGVRGIPRSGGHETHQKETLQSQDFSSMKDFLDYVGKEQYKADRGAILLGNMALSVYGMERDGAFSLYGFTARYNEDIYGTQMPNLPFVHADYPVTVLTEEERNAVGESFQKDPTGARALSNPRLWPKDFRGIVLSPRLDEVREEMQRQIPLYQRFARGILSENPQAGERYQNHPEIRLNPGVASDILSALGDF